MAMDDIIKEQLKYLRLPVLQDTWESEINEATKKNKPYGQFLKEILQAEVSNKLGRAKLQRQRKAKIPDNFEMEKYPFNLQPKLNKKQIVEIYDSKSYLKNQQNIALIGPTGVGKTGLAISFLNNAIDNGFDGRFILFSDLISELYQSIADSTTAKVLKKFTSLDCLVIDELGYIEIDNQAQAGLLFKLIRGRKKSTIITSNLGFDEWEMFLKNANLAAALLNKFTANCNFINMLQCKSITPKLIK
jgi:DNA replication protein DnaC